MTLFSGVGKFLASGPLDPFLLGRSVVVTVPAWQISPASLVGSQHSAGVSKVLFATLSSDLPLLTPSASPDPIQQAVLPGQGMPSTELAPGRRRCDGSAEVVIREEGGGHTRMDSVAGAFPIPSLCVTGSFSTQVIFTTTAIMIAGIIYGSSVSAWARNLIDAIHGVFPSAQPG